MGQPAMQPWAALQTSDLDQLRSFMDPRYYDSSVRLTDPAARLAARASVLSLGPLTIGRVTFGAELGIRFRELGCYHVNVPLSGHIVSQQELRGTVAASRQLAAVYHPGGGVVDDCWSSDCAAFSVRIDAGALHRHLGALTGTVIEKPVRIAPTLDTSSGAGRSWRTLVQWLHADAADGRSAAHHPILRARFEEAVITTLLAAADHPYREQLAAPERGMVAPRAVRRVVNAVQERPEEAYTLAELARLGGLSPRALQQGFERHLGTTPMTYLRDVRLARAHDELRSANGAETTVAAVAYRWGFTHLGRFAQLYRTRYGTLPSVTLRR